MRPGWKQVKTLLRTPFFTYDTIWKFVIEEYRTDRQTNVVIYIKRLSFVTKGHPYSIDNIIVIIVIILIFIIIIINLLLRNM